MASESRGETTAARLCAHRKKGKKEKEKKTGAEQQRKKAQTGQWNVGSNGKRNREVHLLSVQIDIWAWKVRP